MLDVQSCMISVSDRFHQFGVFNRFYMSPSGYQILVVTMADVFLRSADKISEAFSCHGSNRCGRSSQVNTVTCHGCQTKTSSGRGGVVGMKQWDCTGDVFVHVCSRSIASAIDILELIAGSRLQQNNTHAYVSLQNCIFLTLSQLLCASSRGHYGMSVSGITCLFSSCVFARDNTTLDPIHVWRSITICFKALC